MDLLTELDRARSEINVLEHPFYVRWRAGQLSAQELACYAQQYRHAVIALARTSARAAQEAGPSHAQALRGHAEEEAAHVALWERFADATRARAGQDSAGAPGGSLAQTRACVRAWSAGEQLLERLAVLYAIEAGQPEVSRTKLEGLVEHYGYSAEGPATEYFRLHAVRDREHAALASELMAQLIVQAGDRRRVAARTLDRARDALQGNWRLLDGVDRHARAHGARATA